MPPKNLPTRPPHAALLRLLAKAAGLLLVVCLLGACVPLGAAYPAASATPEAPGASDDASPPTPTLPAASPVVEAEVSACRLGDLSASMDWHRSGGALAGRLVLANFGAQPCTVQGAPHIELVNANGWKLPVDQVQAAKDSPPAEVILDPAAVYTAEAAFVWRNWCTPASEGDRHLEVTLPGYPGKLIVPVQDPNGSYLTDTPRCDDRSSPSTLTIKAFK
jgi:hypothetical protein